MTVIFDSLGFESTYACELLGGLSGTAAPPLEFGFKGSRLSREGLVLRVIPGYSASWCGNFAEGDHGLKGAFGTPNPATMLAVARGQGYLVPVESPASYELIPGYPVRDVKSIQECRLLVLITYTELLAYGEQGLFWRSRQISSDGIRIRGVGPSSIEGIAWDAATGCDVEFSVDPETGQVRGGIIR